MASEVRHSIHDSVNNLCDTYTGFAVLCYLNLSSPGPYNILKLTPVMESSPLATLPAELRIYIYEPALTEKEPALLYRIRAPRRQWLGHAQRIQNLLALVQTYKAIRKESYPLPFTASTFAVESRSLELPLVFWSTSSLGFHANT